MIKEIYNTIATAVAAVMAGANVSIERAKARLTEAPEVLEPAAEWLTELAADPRAWVAADPDLAGARVIAHGGVPSGTCPMVMAHCWMANNGEFTKGSPVWAHEDHDFAFVRLMPKVGKLDPEAYFHEMDVITGAVKAERRVPSKSMKFVFNARTEDEDGVDGLALAHIQEWIAQGNGTRRDVVLIAQFKGETKPEKKAPNQLRTNLRWFVLLEVPYAARVTAAQARESLLAYTVSSEAAPASVAEAAAAGETLIGEADELEAMLRELDNQV